MNHAMNNTICGFFALLTLMVGTLTATPAQADEMSDLRDRFMERAPRLLQLRNAGTLGETFAGWVEPVKGAPEKAVADLVTAENNDRKALYALIAARQGIDAAVVAERNALRIFKSSADDHLLKTKDGTWVKKKDATIEG